MKGTLEQAGPRWRLRFTRELDHPVPRVWQAVTEPAHLEAWFPQRVTGDWVAGAPLTFSDPQGRGPGRGRLARLPGVPGQPPGRHAGTAGQQVDQGPSWLRELVRPGSLGDRRALRIRARGQLTHAHRGTPGPV